MVRRETWKHFDFWLFGAVIILSIFGVAMIRSAIAGNEVLSGLVPRQVIYVGISFVIIVVLTAIDYRYWSSLARLMYVFAILSLVAIYVFGTAIYGSARWLDTGLILIQPSELAKIIMIIVLADFFARTKDRVKDLRWIISSFLLTFGVVMWILLQPNLSTSIVIFVLWFSMLFVSGLPLKFVWIFAGIGLVIADSLSGPVILRGKNPLDRRLSTPAYREFHFPRSKCAPRQYLQRGAGPGDDWIGRVVWTGLQ